MKEQLITLITKLAFGKQMAFAMLVLRLIVAVIKEKDVSDVARAVYHRLPKGWKSPEGPASEKEFLSVITTGEAFIKSLHQMTV